MKTETGTPGAFGGIVMPSPAMRFLTAFVLAVLAAACSQTKDASVDASKATLRLASSAFADGMPIPAKYTCDGENISPPLVWSNTPQSAQSLALIADDPDAPLGTWVHWVVYNIPPALTQLEERIPVAETLPDGAIQGTTSFRQVGYGGPCPPAGKPHHYFFKLYALDSQATLKPGATKDDLLKAMEGHVLATGQLMGTYQK
jgi:Raf kinase inhibitor-like YbhB/YbcL family protein